MTDLSLILAFLVAATILTLTPGVDTAMVLRAATVEGKRPAILAALGIALGCLVWGGAVAIGLGGLLRASDLAYTAVKLAGALYLVWLGLKLLLRPRTGVSGEGVPADQTGASSFMRGFLTNLLNPKVGVFYVTFLPQFVPHGASVAVSTFMLALIHVVLGLVWFAVLIAATIPLGRALRRPRVVEALDRLTGAIFIAFGAKLMLPR